MHRFLCSRSCKFPNYFTFTLGCHLFLLFLVQFKDNLIARPHLLPPLGVGVS